MIKFLSKTQKFVTIWEHPVIKSSRIVVPTHFCAGKTIYSKGFFCSVNFLPIDIFIIESEQVSGIIRKPFQHRTCN